MPGPALFLDRDGVINVERDYVHRIEDFEFMPGIFELVRGARAAGYAPIVVTNQAGIGRGYYDEATFHALTAWMLERFAEQGAPIAAVYHCPYHPTHGIGPYRRESPDRKPAPGMLLRAAAEHQLDLARSIMVGDRASDMEAGHAAGVGTLFLLDTATAPVLPAGVRRVGSLSEVRARLALVMGGGPHNEST